MCSHGRVLGMRYASQFILGKYNLVIFTSSHSHLLVALLELFEFPVGEFAQAPEDPFFAEKGHAAQHFAKSLRSMGREKRNGLAFSNATFSTAYSLDMLSMS